MNWCVEIRQKEGLLDVVGDSVFKEIAELGIRGVSKVEVAFLYFIEGDLQEEHLEKICRELLMDKITQRYSYASRPSGFGRWAKVVEIAYKPGVMDPVEESTLKAIRDLGIRKVQRLRTARRYFFYGTLSDKGLNTIINKVLANPLIHQVKLYPDPEVGKIKGRSHARKGRDSLKAPVEYKASSSEKFEVLLVHMRNLNDQKLLSLSRRGQLFLNLPEMRAIQRHFQELKRDPTDCELETIAQTWSEHCFHKTFRGDILYQEIENGRKKTRLIRNLFKSTIARVTTKLKKPWCVSVFHDNAGVIEFDEDSCVCFKVETHNHPSALEPFGGASTGIGGVIRDCLGTGLGAQPIGNTDVFCFAPPDLSSRDLPLGALHPLRVMKGVVAGVRDYGNKMGIPTMNGAILFDKLFAANPLVFCGTVGILPRDKIHKSVHPGDLIVLAGGRTGRDGIHGATFSSGELTQESEELSCGAVQIGNPIQEKKLLDVLLKARDQNLYTAITDCGAGGLSSAVGEMGKDLGCRVDLEKVPLKYKGLRYTEIWISESQERMVLAAPSSSVEKLLAVFGEENVEATVIGEFTDTRRLGLFFHNIQVADLSMAFLYRGIPKIPKRAVFRKHSFKKPHFVPLSDLTPKLLEVLSHYNVCSKEGVIRQYDHEVQGMSVLKPLVGPHADGPSDASVLRLKPYSSQGVVVANGINVRFGMIDPFWMAASSVDEAIRQIIAVGGNLERIAILDNFCWGNPDKPDRLGSLVRAALGCARTALSYGVPFISGKDSLNNEYTHKGKSLAIPGTLLISAIGIINDVHKVVSMDFKKPGNRIYTIGETFEELGGSIYLDTYGLLGDTVPRVDPKQGTKIFQTISRAVEEGLITSLHDCSEGGLAVALAEMSFAGGLGAALWLDKIPYQGKPKRNDTILFSESNSRFVAEVEPHHQEAFEKLFTGMAFAEIGRVEQGPGFVVYGIDGKVCVRADMGDLRQAWKNPLRW